MNFRSNYYKKTVNIYSQRKKQIIAALLMTTVHFLITFLSDRIIFNIQEHSILIYAGFKIVFFFILFSIWFFVIDFAIKIKNNNQIYLRWITIAIIFFVIFSILMLLVWPGNWVWDEKGILENALMLKMNGWQHFLTSLFYIFSLMIIPFPSGVVIIQYTIIALIISYILSTLTNRYGKKSLFIGLIFLMPPVLLHILYPMRINLYTFLELLFFFLILVNIKNERFKGSTMLTLSVLSIILTVWRTEGIFLIIVFPLILLIKKYSKKTVLIVFVSTLLCAGIMVGIQNYHLVLGYDGAVDYNVTGIATPYHSLIRKEYKENKNSALIKSAEKYLNFKEINKYEEGEGEEAFWVGAYSTVDSDGKYKMMLKDYKSLILKHPGTFFYYRFKLFLDTQKVYDDKGKIISVVQEGNINQQIFNLDKYPLGKTINKELRAKILKCLYGKSSLKPLNLIIKNTFNIFVPLLLIILMAIYSLTFIKKGGGQMLIIMSSLLVHFAMVFVTAPATYFMYYFPIYVCGYTLFLSFLLSKICKKTKE